MCLSVQYQRARSSTAAATKTIGMPLASASSMTGGSSKPTLAESSRPSSERSNFSCGISAVAARAATHAKAISTHANTRASQRSGTRKLVQHGVEEPVVITKEIVPNGRGRFPGKGQQMTRRGPQNGLFVVRKKRLHLPLALVPENGASAIDEPSAVPQRGPERRQQPRLRFRELGDVRFAPQPAHVGVAPDDARSGAWRIEQD